MTVSWYTPVTSPGLEQGDILLQFPVLMGSLTPNDISCILGNSETGYSPENDAAVTLVDAIIMTQSCDLEQDKVDSILLCPVWEERLIGEGKNRKEKVRFKEDVRKGYRPGWHLLNKDESLGLPLLFVEFSRIYTAPKDTVIAFAAERKSRPRLVPPYKEHLSQAFARFFMRVGLPAGIPQFR